jgi:hypothetical protein
VAAAGVWPQGIGKSLTLSIPEGKVSQ